jgi:capsular exopolysaccharide synthesis family protein
MFGIAGIAVMSHADRSLQEPGDAASLLGVPELGVIPSTDLKHRAPRHSPYRTLVPDSPQSSQANTQLSAWMGEPSLLADSFRGVVASILFAFSNGARPRVLVITSAGASEGKTTASSNLAQAMAQINSKVLLIDADLRKPRVHKIFGLKNEGGLANLLKEPVLNEKEANRLIRPTEIDNLDILTSGSADSAPNLFFSNSMSPLINHYKKHYDTVIIDTPPMLLVPDARMLGPIADAVVLIVRAGQTTRDAALAVYQRLTSDRTQVLGVVLNDWDSKKSPNGYYGYQSEPYKVAVGNKKPVES